MLRLTTRPRWALVATGYVLLLAAWTFSTVPFRAPDEAAHYLRGYGLSQGHLLGPREHYSGRLTPLQDAWVQHDARGVQIPAGFAPPGVNCIDGHPNVGTCIETSSTGAYPPFAYLLPAAALHGASGLGDALWIARAGSALEVALFVSLAAALLWDGSVLSLLGLVLAVTPMTLFVGSVLNPNGLELAASLALSAGVLRLARPGREPPLWVWWATGAAAVATLLAWQLGPAYLALNLALLAALLGPRRIRAVVAAQRRRLAFAASGLVLAATLFFAYGLHAGAIHSTLHLSPLRYSLQSGLNQLGGMVRQAIGNFGELSVAVDDWIFASWILLLAGLLLWGLTVARRQMRLLIGAAAVLAVLFPVLFYGFVYRYTGFLGLQARYVLPGLFVVPLLSGEAIRRAELGRAAELAGGAAIALAAALQLAAWWDNAQANAGIPGAAVPDPFSGARWLPPGGWMLWVPCAVLGALALAAAGRPRSRQFSG